MPEANTKSIKSLSLEQIEAAMGAALSELVGKPITVNIQKFEVIPATAVAHMLGRAGESFRMELSGGTPPRKDAGEDVPF